MALAYVAGLAALAIPAYEALNGSPILWSDEIKVQTLLLIIIPAIALLFSVTSSRHSMAASMYWTWSLIFAGLAVSYQLAIGRFPWGGVLQAEDIYIAQRVLILGHVCVLLAFFVAGRFTKETAEQPAAPLTGQHPKLQSAATTVLLGHAGIAAVFAALMGSGLFSGRFAFQGAIASNGGIPGFATIMFLAQAGAVIVPTVGIVLRRAGAKIPSGVLLVSVAASAYVTNPFIGSRFLTGAFLVAFVAAIASHRARRWLPVGMVLAFVTIFPTLDLLRGDGTGATEVKLSEPSETLTTFDYDAFEMLVREVSIQGEMPAGVPTTGELLIAPFLRFIPFISPLVEGDASGPAVAAVTGMPFFNVSMPLWGEAHLMGSWAGVAVVFLALGVMLARTRSFTGGRGGIFGMLIEIPLSAMLFIILRGSLYEVLGYLLLAVTVAAVLAQKHRRDQEATLRRSARAHKAGVSVLSGLRAVENARQH